MAKQSKYRLSLDFNAPVILGMTIISFAILLAVLALGSTVKQLFGVYYSSWADPFMYMRLFTHVLTHVDLAHYTGNFMLILAVGPMVEEKYGSKQLLIMIAITALITGLIHVIFFHNIILMGASGVVFMLVLLASYVNIREGHIPITVILVAALYIGNEIVTGVLSSDDISQISHIIGGLCGGIFGFVLRIKRKA